MIKCVHCGNDAERLGTEMSINVDGDFVCGEECKTAYEKERDNFFNETIHDDKKFEEWLGVSFS